MTFLILSKGYPNQFQRQEFIRKAGPYAKNASPFHKPLAASTNDTSWRAIISIWKEHVNSSILHDNLNNYIRPLKPNDDNYQVFIGDKWKPDVDVAIPPQLQAMLGNGDNDVYPHYDHCANCTKPAINKCSKCKIVRYCSQDCQAKHWKAIHRSSCVPAQTNFSLWKALHGNDGFYLTVDECALLSNGLYKELATGNDGGHDDDDDDDLIRYFAVYFEYVANLDGCFVI